MWGSLWRRTTGRGTMLLSEWPVPRPGDRAEFVNEPHGEAELAALRRSVDRVSPFGEVGWVVATARELGLESTLRERGRPRKELAAAGEDGGEEGEG